MKHTTQNLWEVYGFKENPFNTTALSIDPKITLSIKNAYIDRSTESNRQVHRFEHFFRNPGGGRIVVEGVPGVGKTTFVNSFRYKWGYVNNDKLLSPLNAIQIRDVWGPTEFLSSSVFHIIHRLRLYMGQQQFNKNKTLVEIASAVAVYREEITGFGVGFQSPFGGVSFEKQPTVTTTISNLDPDLLHHYLRLLITVVKDLGFKGFILHYDNLETIPYAALLTMMDSIRDYLQTTDIYFIFVGRIGTFRNIVYPKERVRSIFVSNPIIVEPLSSEATSRIIQRRCEVCALADDWILPVDQKLVDLLFKIFDGKIRPIMNEIENLVSEIDGSLGPVSLDQALFNLQQIKYEALANLNIYDFIKEVFLEAIPLKKFTASQLAKRTGKTRQFISNKCIGPLLENNLIKPAENVGRSQYYEIESDYLLLGLDSMST